MPFAVPFCRYISTRTDGETALVEQLQVEGERVAEVLEDEVDEALRGALQVEDVGPAVGVGEEQVRHLLQAGDEPQEVAGLVVAAVVLGEHLPQVEAPRRRLRGPEAAERGAVEGREHDVAEAVRHARRPATS